MQTSIKQIEILIQYVELRLNCVFISSNQTNLPVIVPNQVQVRISIEMSHII